jgi:hypothetical protein
MGAGLMARNAEAQIQAAIVQYVRTVAPDVLIFHVPNGGLRSKSEAARLKWQGVVPGIPDLVLLWRYPWHSPPQIAFFEIKAPKGRLSFDQCCILEWLDDQGFSYAIVRSIDDARTHLAKLGIPTRDSSSAVERAA